MSTKFDHIEVHVSDIQKYCAFLQKVFERGNSAVISSSGTSMFTSPDGLNIEVIKRGSAREYPFSDLSIRAWTVWSKVQVESYPVSNEYLVIRR